MRLFHLTKYTLFRPDFYLDKSLKHDDPFKIVVISDIHFSYLVSNEKLDLLANFIAKIRPKYIFLPGDLVDSLTMIQIPGEQERLLNWLRKLGEISKLLISLGNHDEYEKKPNKRGSKRGLIRGWLIENNASFMEKVASLPNVFVLNNDKYEDEHIYAFGLTLSPDYYNLTDNISHNPFRPRHEDIKKMGQEIDTVNQKLIHNLPKDKIKFALIHSPVCLKEKQITDRLKEFDYFISGHMHNGIMPPLFNEIIRNTKGIIAPTKGLFPKNSRNTFKSYKDKLMVFGAITTFHECTGPLHHCNAIYPSYLGEIDFTNDKKYATKPGISYKYMKRK